MPRREALIPEEIGMQLEQEPVDVDVVIDGIIGFAVWPATGLARSFIEWCATRRVVSLDVPSGLDATTGETPGVFVSAEVTMTLAAPKRGMIVCQTTGRVFLAGIPVPPSIYRMLGGEIATPFERSPIVELKR